MESLSSSFLQKYALNHTVSSPSPLQHLQFSVSAFTDQKYFNTISSTVTFPLKIPKTSFNDKIKQLLHRTDEINRPKINSFFAIIFNALDNFICDHLDPPLRLSVDPKHVLSGNFAPVDELPPTPCDVVEGYLPPSLNGAYIRNGPNPQFFPRGPYHLFDGDGMLHAITITGGKATFCSRFVKTYKYNKEREIGSPVLILNVFSAFNGLLASFARCSVALGRFLTGQYDLSRGVGNANTSLALLCGKLFAMAESDLPYRVKLTSDGDVITLGRHECFGKPFMTMTAHPKTDADTGEAFAFRHSIMRPFLTYFRINPEGIKLPEVPINSLNQASLVHDFAVTKHYVVFPETQILIKPEVVLTGRAPFTFDPDKPPKLGIIQRYAEDDSGMWWTEVPGFNMLHVANAWEEDGGDTIVMVASNVQPVEHMLYAMDSCQSSLERIEINVRSKSVRRRSISTRNLDFAVINPDYVGKNISVIFLIK